MELIHRHFRLVIRKQNITGETSPRRYAEVVVNLYADISKRPAGIGYIAQALVGALCGGGLGGAIGLLGARIFAGTGDGWGDLIAAIVGAIIGYTIGVSLGVYLTGRWLNRRDRRSTQRWGYWLALLGSVLGAALVLLLAEPLHLNQNTAVLQALVVILPPIGATLGFNLRRKA